MLNKDSILFFDKDAYKIKKNKGTYLFISEKYRSWLKTSETGKDILCLLDGKRDVKDVIYRISKEYDMAEEKISEHILQFCQHLQDIKFVGAEQKEINKKLENIYIDVTNACEFSCVYCNKCIKNSKQNQDYMTTEQVKQIFNNLKHKFEKNKTVVHITGGEPLLNPDIIEILEYINNLNYIIVIWTSGYTLNKYITEKIKSLIKMIYLPLDSIDKEINDQIRGKGAYDTTLNAIKLLNEYQINYCIASTPTVYNYEKIDNIVEFAYDNGAIGMYVNQPIKIKENGLLIDKCFDYTLGQFIELEEKLLRKSDIIKSWRNNNIKKDRFFSVMPSRFKCLNLLGKISAKENCGLGINELSIDVKGNIYPCSMLQFDKIKEDINLNSNNYNVECNECEYKMFCLGGCKALNYYSNGDLNGKNILCDYTKNFYKTLLWG